MCLANKVFFHNLGTRHPSSPQGLAKRLEKVSGKIAPDCVTRKNPAQKFHFSPSSFPCWRRKRASAAMAAGGEISTFLFLLLSRLGRRRRALGTGRRRLRRRRRLKGRGRGGRRCRDNQCFSSPPHSDHDHGTLQNRRDRVFSVDFVPTVPPVGIGGAVWGVQALARGPYQVPLLSADGPAPQQAQLTASPICPPSPAKKIT